MQYKKFSLLYKGVLICLLAGVCVAHQAFATLSCSVTTAAACSSGTIIMRMSAATNAHAELPSGSTAAYASNVMCCTGVAGLGNSCSGTYGVVAGLSAATNAHIQQGTVGTYASQACMSAPTGNTVSVGYQSTNCTGYDTTLGSMSGSDNAQVGDTTAYTTKICASVAQQNITFSLSANSVDFGSLSSSATRYATSSAGGSASEPGGGAHTISVSTNAGSGYTLTVSGATLTSGANTITAIGATAASPAVGTNQFGLRATVSGGTGTVVAPYNDTTPKYGYDTSTQPDVLATASAGSTDTYTVNYIANISATKPAGSYTTTLTYIATASF